MVYRNLDEDMGIDHLIAPPGPGNAIALASIGGAFRGPGLSWPELLNAAGHTRRTGSGAAWAARLLLLPILGDADLPDNAAAPTDPTRNAPPQPDLTKCHWSTGLAVKSTTLALACPGLSDYRLIRSGVGRLPE